MSQLLRCSLFCYEYFTPPNTLCNKTNLKIDERFDLRNSRIRSSPDGVPRLDALLALALAGEDDRHPRVPLAHGRGEAREILAAPMSFSDSELERIFC